MMRSHSFLAAVVAAALIPCGGPSRASNLNFNFNGSNEGWTFGTIPPVSGTATPFWDWYGPPSKSDGAIEARTASSGSAVIGAWAMSPCLEILQQSESQRYIHVDFSHFTQLPQGAFGQVQFRISGSTGFVNNWQGIPTPAWSTSNHVVPATGTNGLSPAPPLVNSPGFPPNLWLAFSGTINATNNSQAQASGSGPHVLSAFTLQWDDYGLANGSEVQFRFMVAVDETYQPPTPDQVLWEVNLVTIDGARLCVVPEPTALAVAAAGLACVGGVLARGRTRHRRRSSG